MIAKTVLMPKVFFYTENWRQFFDQAKKQKTQESRSPSEGTKVQKGPISLPPIRYMGEDVELVPGDPGMRLLHSVTIKSKVYALTYTCVIM
jgi:hypothetical protein